jgi:hypothetical protein
MIGKNDPPNKIEKDFVVGRKTAHMELYGEGEEAIEMKQINRSALSEATVALVLSTHASPNGRVTNNDKSLAKYNPF